MNGQEIDKYNLAKQAIEMEREILKENVGIQDQIAAAFGGFNHIKFNTDDSFEVIPINISQEKSEILQSHLLLFFKKFDSSK